MQEVDLLAFNIDGIIISDMPLSLRIWASTAKTLKPGSKLVLETKDPDYLVEHPPQALPSFGYHFTSAEQ